MNILEYFNTTGVSDLNDPFSRDCIKSIHIHISKGDFTDNIYCTANVKFKNEDTEGTHKIKADDFKGLVSKVDSFINTLVK